MFKTKLNRIIEDKNSLVCVGLDCDIRRIPKFLLNEKDPLLTFNKAIIEATKEFALAFKINIAFYETLGTDGWRLLEKTLNLIPGNVLLIADAKRADIGNTCRKYAELYFDTYDFEAITVSPYMGLDSLSPFLEYDDRCIFVLCLTSNTGAQDFQYLNTDSETLFLKVAQIVAQWDLAYGNCGLVAGATHPEDLGSIREAAPNLPLLIPGIGSQGGNLKMAVEFGTNQDGGCALVSASRSIIYASSKRDFAEAANRAAAQLHSDINRFREFKLSKG
jgi:orotidine-5'-phosphate decarboxylase